MKRLKQKDINYLIKGSSLLSTGGGGTITAAKKITEQIRKLPYLIDAKDLKKHDTVITIFPCGGIEKGDFIKPSIEALKLFQEMFDYEIGGIIPVEIGPLDLLNSIYLASELKLPLLDGDIVGNRCSPEIYLETISLSNIPRTPIVTVNDRGDIAILYESSSYTKTEKFLRDFAVLSGGIAIVLGYPLNKKQIIKTIGQKTVTSAINLGKKLYNAQKGNNADQILLRSGFAKIADGIIVKENKKVKNGFTSGRYIVETGDNVKYTIIIKNENIVLLQEGKEILTVPDSIILYNKKSNIGVSNFEKNIRKRVLILGKKAIPIWRTEKGKSLFSPKKLGFQYKQKLL